MAQAQAGVQPQAAYDDLHPALRPINRNVSEDQHVLAVCQIEVRAPLVAEEHAGDLRIPILEGEVSVTGAMVDDVGDLSPRPEVVQAGIIFQAAGYALIQLGDGEYRSQAAAPGSRYS